jgi:hypothetical protein
LSSRGGTTASEYPLNPSALLLIGAGLVARRSLVIAVTSPDSPVLRAFRPVGCTLSRASRSAPREHQTAAWLTTVSTTIVASGLVGYNACHPGRRRSPSPRRPTPPTLEGPLPAAPRKRAGPRIFKRFSGSPLDPYSSFHFDAPGFISARAAAFAFALASFKQARLSAPFRFLLLHSFALAIYASS